MIKKIVIVAPEFSKGKILNVPWKQVFELATRLNKRGIKTAIATSNCKDEFENIPIINLNEPIAIRKLSDDSINKIKLF